MWRSNHPGSNHKRLGTAAAGEDWWIGGGEPLSARRGYAGAHGARGLVGHNGISGGTRRGRSAGDGDPAARVVGVGFGVEVGPALAIANGESRIQIEKPAVQYDGAAWSAAGPVRVHTGLLEGDQIRGRDHAPFGSARAALSRMSLIGAIGIPYLNTERAVWGRGPCAARVPWWDNRWGRPVVTCAFPEGKRNCISP